MEEINSEKLVERIEEAKDWLEKAKDEYNNANPIRGGLILNLAQAEVKNAWELSHRHFVSKSVPQADQKRKFKYVIPIAASFALIAGLTVGLMVSGFPPSKNLAPASIAESKVEPGNNLQGVAPVKPQSNLASTPSIKPEETVLINQPGNSPGTRIPMTAEQTNSVRTVSSLAEHNGSEFTQDKSVPQNKPVLKPVSQLSIDEEDLTKEASHSLRIGK